MNPYRIQQDEEYPNQHKCKGDTQLSLKKINFSNKMSYKMK